MKYGYIFILASALSLCGCSDKELSRPQSPEEPDMEETVTGITVTRSSFARDVEEPVVFSTSDATDDGVSDEHNWRYNTPDNMLPGGDEEEFTDQGILFISQITPTRTPSFPATPWADWFQKSPEDRGGYTYYWETDAGKKEYAKFDNLWMYKLDKTLGENADWDSGYNFVPVFSEDDETFKKNDGTFNQFRMNWKTIKDYGSLGNAFSFYALYYPGGDPIFQVNGHQSIWDLTVMKQMDVMGAYHSTPSLYTRMRFKLYHLMVYIRVTLYVPVVEPKYADNETNKTPENAIGYTGFGRDAFYWEVPQGSTNGRPGIYITSKYKWSSGDKTTFTQYGIDWRANRSSDSEAPLVQANTSGGTADEAMHRHATFEHIRKPGFDENNVNGDRGYYLPDTPQDTDEPEVFEIDRSIFMKEVPEGENPIEKVRRYEFSALIPPQSLRNGTNSNLLLIRLATPGISELPPEDLSQTQGTYREFSFDARTAELVKDGQATLTQGTLQHFYLYIPRSGNKTIVLKANVEPWKSTQTDMTVTEEKTNPEDQQTK